MDIKNRKVIIYIFAITSVLLLVSGLLYEDAYGSRKTLLMSLILIYFGAIVLMVIQQQFIKYIGIILGVALLLVIEYNSKFAVNYFFHFSYIVLTIYVIIDHSIRSGIYFSVFVSLGAFFKFIQLVLIQPTQGNLAMLVFFFIIQVLIIITSVVAKNYWMENDKSRRLYKELLETYKQLEAFSSEIKELTLYEARTKIARDLHDTLGHEMTGLIMQIEMASRFLGQEDIEKAKELLEEAKKSARESLSKVQQIVDTLKNEGSIEWANQSIYELVQVFATKTNTQIDCYITGEREASLEVGVTLYRVVQESLTNAIRHGQATQITVGVDYLERIIAFKISDNGRGCKESKGLVMGNGLKGMKERVEALEGTIEFDYKDQFIIKGVLPYEGDK